MTWEERLSLVEEYEASGAPVQAWCKGKGIPYTTFLQWRKKAQQKVAEGEVQIPVTWVGVSMKEQKAIAAPANNSAIRISRKGWTITVETGFDAELLTEALRALGRTCC